MADRPGPRRGHLPSPRLRRPPRPRLRLTWTLSIAVALAITGFVAAAQWNSSVARQQYTTSAQQVLAGQVLALESEQKDLRQQLADAEGQVQRFQTQTAGSQTALDQVNKELAAARLAAGLTRVTGPGVVVEIADSNRPVPAGDNPQNYIVLVDDLHDLVAALWSAGAEAITVNDERLVSTSSIYGVGASILVNTAFLSPPFRIEAIGPDGLLERFMADPAYLGRVAHRIDAFGLEFAAQANSSLTLPAFIGSTRFRWAVPSEGG
jgi:uncharacterized protein YlxW (UPF0749 family)